MKNNIDIQPLVDVVKTLRAPMAVLGIKSKRMNLYVAIL